MGAYKYIAQTLQKQYKERDADYRAKVISWRAGPAMVKVEKPSNIARARRLGYQAKQGYIVVRARVDKGRRARRRPMGGRKHKNYHVFEQPQISHQAIVEQRVNRIYKNMEVLNSYWVGEDGNYKFYEVILADPAKPSVNISSVIRQGKAFRGLTSAGNSRKKGRKRKWNKKLQRKDLVGKPHPSATPFVKKESAPKAERRTPPVRKAKPKKAAPKPETSKPGTSKAPKAEEKK
ncbi:MAG: 50S ribosomal protein L15e [Candidatus Micrarchaeota archaeon]